MSHNEHDYTFKVGSLLTIVYNFYNFLTIQNPFLVDLFKTVFLSIVGVVASALTGYILKKFFPKLFKK